MCSIIRENCFRSVHLCITRSLSQRTLVLLSAVIISFLVEWLNCGGAKSVIITPI